MAGPKKRLGKGKNRLKFKDVSPRAEKGDQVHVKKYKDEDLIDLSPSAEADERKEVTGKKYGGRMKKPVAMGYGGKVKKMKRRRYVPWYGGCYKRWRLQHGVSSYELF